MIKFDFSGKRALVTGAGKGIGRALTIALSAAGAEVVAVTRTQADLDTLKTECSGPIVPICVDLSDWDATRKAVKEAGPVHFLVNNAGTGFLAPCLEATPEQFDKIMNVNVKAVMNVTQVVAKGMIDRGQGGSIVMVSSQASQRAFKDHMIYCASKGALDQMTRMFALELGTHKIRVNSVNPTVVMTDLGKMAWSEPTKAKEMLSRIPMNKFASEADIVHPILYLLSDQSDMIHGSTLPIDGGFWAA